MTIRAVQLLDNGHKATAATGEQMAEEPAATGLQALEGGAAEPEPTIISTVEELTEHMRQQASAGNVGDVIALMEVAKEMGGEDLSERLYGEIARPIMQARKDAWVSGEPGAAELTEDEVMIALVMAYEHHTAETVTPAQAAKLRLAIRRGRHAESADGPSA